MKEQCETCFYYQRHYVRANPSEDNPDPPKQYSGEGECRRYPPVQLIIRDTLRIGGPLVEPTEWCGEWSYDEGQNKTRSR